MILIPILYRELLSVEDRLMAYKPTRSSYTEPIIRGYIRKIQERINNVVNPILASEGERKGWWSRPLYRGLDLLDRFEQLYISKLGLTIADSLNLAPEDHGFTVLPFRNFSICSIIVRQRRDDDDAIRVAKELYRLYGSDANTLCNLYKIFAGYIFIDTNESRLFYRARLRKGTHYYDYSAERKEKIAAIVENILNENEQYLNKQYPDGYHPSIPIPRWIQTIPFEKVAYREGVYEITIGFTPTASGKNTLVEPVLITTLGTVKPEELLKYMGGPDNPEFTLVDALLVWAMDKTKNPVQLFFEKNLPGDKHGAIMTYLFPFVFDQMRKI